MFSLIAIVLIFFVWVGSFIAIIRIDAGRQRAAAQARGEVDFVDRSVTPYLVLAFLSGALPLIFDFGVTRKGGVGWLLGLGVFAADVVAVSIVGSLLFFGGTAIDRSLEHSKNVKFFERANAACAAPLDRSHAKTDPCKDALEPTNGSNDFTFAWNHSDGKPYSDIYVKACNGGRPWACGWLVHGGNFYGADATPANLEAWAAKKTAFCKPDPTIDKACTEF